MDDVPVEGPVTLIFSRRVKPGRESAYREWVASFQGASREVRGFLGATTFGKKRDSPEYMSVVSFDSLENLRSWEDSPLRREWLARLPADTVDGEAQTRRLEGLEFWFTPPGTAASSVPSPHKMALVLVVIVFTLVATLTPVVRAALGDAPQLARSAVMVLLQVGLMTYVIMPRVTKLLGAWLFNR